MLDDLRRRLARAIAPKSGARMYAAARPSRLTANWGTSVSSADTELFGSLPSLRSRSRALVRDAGYAKRAKRLVQNNVIGTGIGMQAQVSTTRGNLAQNINDAIEREWNKWSRADSCHTGGELHFADLERLAMGQVFEAGEVLIRKHYQAAGESKVPLSLELVESELLADDIHLPAPKNAGAEIRMGVEVDGFGRPLGYWLRRRHPGELRFDTVAPSQIFYVPAEQIIHLRIIDRWPQTRGEPWLHAVAKKLNDMDGYTEAEIVAARGAASYMGFIEVDQLDAPAGEQQADGTEQLELSPGMIGKLGPGEKFQAYAPNRPNSALDAFLRYMLREVSAGLSVSYASLSADYSETNYSSSRLALLDDRDAWRTLQQWFIRAFREPLHREWLDQAVLSGAIPEISLQQYGANAEKFQAVSFKPRGWSWVDPTKEVEAYKEAIRAGLTSTSRVIAATADGADLEDIIADRRREKALLEAADIVLDTEVAEPVAPAPKAAAAPPEDSETEDAADQPAATESARALKIVGVAT
jgi:lambda family phage portal protein